MANSGAPFVAPVEIVPFQVLSGWVFDGDQAPPARDWWRYSESRLWRELCLCILSSRTKFEVAVEVQARLVRTGLLIRLRKRPELVSYMDVEKVLRPGKWGGSRAFGIPFWRTRARQLVQAARLLYGDGKGGLKGFLSRFRDPDRMRSELVERVPGLGMKQASHFLQNIQFSHDFAIIDSHVVRFLRDELMIDEAEADGLQRGAYLRLEWQIQRIAATNGLDMRMLDKVIWSMRGR